jgi:fumarate reductase flavoprotein subunit
MKKAMVDMADFSIWVICILMFACFSYLYSFLAFAAEPLFLADRHKNSGINCESCQKENPPSEPIPMQVCLGCHGVDYSKLAERTKKVPSNPHASHLGNAQCAYCHHGHRPSGNYCAKCHPLFWLSEPSTRYTAGRK